jgi:protein-tyrosine phosphatase
MATEVLNVTSDKSYRQSIREAATALRDGGLIAIPTETVYGLAVSADCASAVERLRELKGRNDGGPFTVHLADRDDFAGFLNQVTPFAKRLVGRGWPGPLTLVFDVHEPADTAVARGRDPGFVARVFHERSVGLRCPDCLPACDVIRESGCVVLATSANPRGGTAPTTAQQVLATLDGAVDLVMDGGPSKYGKASTIVRVDRHRLEVLREGVLDARTVRRLGCTTVLLVCTGNTCRSPMAEGLLRRLLAERLGCAPEAIAERGFEVRSAGTFAACDAPATPEAVAAMRARGVDISRHCSSALTPEMIQDSQIVLAMTRGHLAVIEGMAPEAVERCHLLGEEDIQDPVGGTFDLYEACRDQIEAALKRQVAECIL